MKTGNYKNACGMTIIESIIAMAVILLVILGTSSFRYNSALAARKADMQISATRLGSVLLETWKGTKGDLSYDPLTEFGSDLTISISTSGPAAPNGFSQLNKYRVNLNNVDYYVTLSYKNATPTEAMALNVCVAWMNDNTTWSDSGQSEDVKLTTYAGNY